MNIFQKNGNTYKEIIRKIKIDFNLRLGDYKSNSNSVLKKSAKIIFKFSNLLNRIRPDIIIVLGDKYETLIITFLHLFAEYPLPIFMVVKKLLGH